MSEHTITPAEVSSHTLAAETIDTLTFSAHVASVWVRNTSGTAPITVAVNGRVPVVNPESLNSDIAKQGMFVLPAVAGAKLWMPTPGAWEEGGTVVKLISTGTPEYSVCEGANRQGRPELELI